MSGEVIAAVDLGSYYAVALGRVGAPGATLLTRDGKKLEHGPRLLAFHQDMHVAICHHGARKIYYEQVRRHEGTDAAHLYGAFYGIMVLAAHMHHVPVEGVPVANIKKFGTGRGNADKRAMVEAAARLGYADLCQAHAKNPNDNAADALVMLEYAKALERRAEMLQDDRSRRSARR
jgi:crossover junction endodeoxyribonuclease RuvC